MEPINFRHDGGQAILKTYLKPLLQFVNGDGRCELEPPSAIVQRSFQPCQLGNRSVRMELHQSYC